MSTIQDRLWDHCAQSGRPWSEVMRHHILEGLLRRLARVPHDHALMLRGGMLTRLWARPAPRPAQDVDFVGLGSSNVEVVARFFHALLATSTVRDEVTFILSSLRATAIWQETAFPGVRLSLRARLHRVEQLLSVDIGFHDPLVPAGELLAYPTLSGETAAIWAVRPETALAWKVHGLSEKGARRWRPKDLYDIVLIGATQPLERAALGAAISAAFTSRGDPVTAATAVFGAAGWWHTKSAQVRWEEYRQANRGLPIPHELAPVVQRAAQVLFGLEQGVHP